MNDYACGIVEGLGMAILLASKHGSKAKQLMKELGDLTQRIQVIAADEKMSDLENWKPHARGRWR